MTFGYCDTKHPDDQIADPHYCIARLTKRAEKLTSQLTTVTAERDLYREALAPLAEQDCESWGCDTNDPEHYCPPRIAREALELPPK